MEKSSARKLIKQGRSGLTVYLPKHWLDARRLREGDSVTIREAEAALIVTGARQEKSSITIEITAQNRSHLTYVLTHAYRRGFDTIRLHGKDGTWIDEAAAVATSSLLGFEVTARDGTSVTLESVSEPTDEQYEPLVRRAFLIIKETQRLTEESMRTSTYSNAVKDLMHQQQRIIFFCKRVLAKGHYTQSSPAVQWELLSFLLYIEHQQHYLYEYARKKGHKASQQILAMLQDLQEYFDLYYRAFYERKQEHIYAMLTRRHELHFGSSVEALEKAKGKDAVVISYIREILRWINLGSSAVFSGIADQAHSPDAIGLSGSPGRTPPTTSRGASRRAP